MFHGQYPQQVSQVCLDSSCIRIFYSNVSWTIPTTSILKYALIPHVYVYFIVMFHGQYPQQVSQVCLDSSCIRIFYSNVSWTIPTTSISSMP